MASSSSSYGPAARTPANANQAAPYAKPAPPCAAPPAFSQAQCITEQELLELQQRFSENNGDDIMRLRSIGSTLKDGFIAVQASSEETGKRLKELEEKREETRKKREQEDRETREKREREDLEVRKKREREDLEADEETQKLKRRKAAEDCAKQKSMEAAAAIAVELRDSGDA